MNNQTQSFFEDDFVYRIPGIAVSNLHGFYLTFPVAFNVIIVSGKEGGGGICCVHQHYQSDNMMYLFKKVSYY